MADFTWRFNRVIVQFSRLKKRGSELQRRDVRGAMFRQRERTKTVGHGHREAVVQGEHWYAARRVSE
jgi:hypothetical protein